MNFLILVLATLSIWDYPERQPQHDRLRNQFVVAMREGDTSTMEETCRKGVELLPDDPTWHYNLACSLAYYNDCEDKAFDELEKAIDLGFRDVEKISSDADLKRLSKHARYGQLIEYAKEMRTKPLMTGPMATVDATGIFGNMLTLGEQNLGWDFDVGCFVAHMKLAQASTGGNVGDLYMNRDGLHSALAVTNYPGLTAVRLDKDGRDRQLDLNWPNVLFPYPVFGNASRAFLGAYWRSIPRALMTGASSHLREMARFYLSNQVWVFPSNADTPPVGTNGDVFASITPYWMTTAGRSWSDQPYLRAALEASRSFSPQTKRMLVDAHMLAPTIQTLIRKSLVGVKSDDDYLSSKAHPTALPPNGVELPRLVAAAKALVPEAVPPLAAISVSTPKPKISSAWPELTYATVFAWAYVLRTPEPERVFYIRARGAQTFRFVQTHGDDVDVKIETPEPGVACVTLRKVDRLSPTNRVDIAVFGKNKGTGWGAPSYLSISRMDPEAPYSDPALTILPQPKSK